MGDRETRARPVRVVVWLGGRAREEAWRKGRGYMMTVLSPLDKVHRCGKLVARQVALVSDIH